tara:strand:- start:1757 stop:2443 length:687 start_codon:yes stop_codon:yes gene_type:complete
MKLLFELLTLLLLFILFRGAIKRFLPKKTEMDRFSPESLKALRRFRGRYFQLLLLFILIFGTGIFFLLVWINSTTLMAPDSLALYFPLKNSAFWQASILGGLLVGSLVAFRLNRKMQKDGLSFYLEELQELAQGYQSFGTFRYLQYGLGLLLFAVLSYSALSSGIALDKASVTIIEPFGQYDSHSFTEIKKLDIKEDTQLLLDEKDTINLSFYKIDTLRLNLFIEDLN